MQSLNTPKTETKTKKCTKWDDDLCKYDNRYRKKYSWKFCYRGCWCCCFKRTRKLGYQIFLSDLLDIPKQIRKRFKIKYDRDVHGMKLTAVPKYSGTGT